MRVLWRVEEEEAVMLAVAENTSYERAINERMRSADETAAAACTCYMSGVLSATCGGVLVWLVGAHR